VVTHLSTNRAEHRALGYSDHCRYHWSKEVLDIKPSTRSAVVTVGCSLVNDQYCGGSGVLRMSLLLVSTASVIVVGVWS